MKKIIITAILLSALTMSGAVTASFTKQIQDVSVSASSEEDLNSQIQNITKDTESQVIRVSYNNKTKSTTLGNLGISVKTSSYTTATDKISNLASKFTKLKNYKLKQEIQVNPEVLELNLLNLFNLPSQIIEPTLQLDKGKFIVQPGSSKYSISNLNQVLEQIQSIRSISENPIIMMETKVKQPNVSDSEILSHQEKLNSFEPTLLTLTYDDGRHNYILNLEKSDLQVDHTGLLILNDNNFQKVLSELKPIVESQKEDLLIQKIDETSREIKLEGNLINGVKIDVGELKNSINQILNENLSELEIPVLIDEATVINNHNNKPYTLLGQGISNYTGSGAGRVHNIEFASSQRYKSILVPKNEKFEFNSHLGGPVTISRGWKNAYVISGGEIVPAPGGGICQMSTTFYRAALQSGLQIDKKSNHSLYVHYYAAYGDGLDAAIFPGSKDLHFTNNTPDNIILHSRYTENQDLIVSVIGISDGRTIQLDGPFTAGDNNTNPYGIQTRTNQINWVRQITSPTGETKQETLTSTYSRFYRK